MSKMKFAILQKMEADVEKNYKNALVSAYDKDQDVPAVEGPAETVTDGKSEREKSLFFRVAKMTEM